MKTGFALSTQKPSWKRVGKTRNVVGAGKNRKPRPNAFGPRRRIEQVRPVDGQGRHPRQSRTSPHERNPAIGGGSNVKQRNRRFDPARPCQRTVEIDGALNRRRNVRRSALYFQTAQFVPKPTRRNFQEFLLRIHVGDEHGGYAAGAATAKKYFFGVDAPLPRTGTEKTYGRLGVVHGTNGGANNLPFPRLAANAIHVYAQTVFYRSGNIASPSQRTTKPHHLFVGLRPFQKPAAVKINIGKGRAVSTSPDGSKTSA